MSEEPVIEILREIFDIAVAAGSVARNNTSGIIPNPFDCRYENYVIRVDYNGGSSKHLILTATYDAVARSDHAYRGGAGRALAAPRPLSIELRWEDTSDVAAKAKGLNVEWQTGDPAFDQVVYIDSPTTDPEVLSAVINPEVRRAVRELLGIGFKTVGIDEGGDGSVSAYLDEFSSSEPPPPGRGQNALRAFTHLLANLPAITSSGRLVQRTPLLPMTIFLSAIGIAGWFGNFFFVKGVFWVMELALGMPEDSAGLVWSEYAATIAIGVVVGSVGAFLYGRIVGALARGTSSAAKNVMWAQIAAFGGTSVVVFTAAVVALVLSHAK